MTLKQIVSQIADRPAMFLGNPTISRLEAFLLGWTHEKTDQEESDSLVGFTKWIAEQYGIKSSQSWARIIHFYSPDDRSALNEAFNLFDKYFEIINAKSNLDDEAGVPHE